MPDAQRRNLIPFQRKHPTRFPRLERWLATCGYKIGQLAELSRGVDPYGVGVSRRNFYRSRVYLPNLRTVFIFISLSRAYPGVGEDGGPLVLGLWDWDVEGYRDGATEATGGGADSGS